MATREKTIEFEMAYCQHYTRGKGPDMVCAKGMDLKQVQVVNSGKRQYKWGPCIDGHTLDNPTSHCPHWIRRTREQGEKRADAIIKYMNNFEIASPLISAWRKKKPIGKAETIECPVCKGRMHLSQAASNGHVHGKCETKDCLSWME